jgi:hypothetical protein
MRKIDIIMGIIESEFGNLGYTKELHELLIGITEINYIFRIRKIEDAKLLDNIELKMVNILPADVILNWDWGSDGDAIFSIYIENFDK